MLALGLGALAGFLIGSVPTAYLLVRQRHGLDVHREGSGNVGANNALRTSGSKATGVLVLLGDALKGAAAVLFGWWLADALDIAPFSAASVALLAAIAGHNYNPWLSLRAGHLVGGKGLATAAGGFGLLLPWLLVVWLAGFAVGVYGFAAWRGVRDVIAGNVVATVLVPFAAWGLYGGRAGLVVAVLAFLVLPKHTAQVRTLLRSSLDSPRKGGGTEANP